jgi:glyoxylase-like metal-dependent hydrolase (beta-lactamase superfamily II)
MREQETTIWMDGRPRPPDYARYTWSGFSTGEWDGGTLVQTATHLKEAYIRRWGPMRSDQATVRIRWKRIGDYLRSTVIIYDPVYLDAPYVRTSLFWAHDPQLVMPPYPCEEATETVVERGTAPHYLPGRNLLPAQDPTATDRFRTPYEARLGGVETMYPEYIATMRAGRAGDAGRTGEAGRAGRADAPWKPPIPTIGDGSVHVLPVRGNVYMLVGAGGNITVQAGEEGVLVVDTGRAAMSEKVLAAIRTISPRPLRYVVNTNERDEHTGGNETIAAAGKSIPFRLTNPSHVQGTIGTERASVISFLTVFHRMSAPTGQVAPRAEAAWPDNTYSTPQKKLFFNDEPVLIMHRPSNTDGNSIVHFRTADVVSTGDLVDLGAYPFIDVAAGGSIDALVESLNSVIDITVPGRTSEGGTLVIPGHGRLADQPDIVYYQQMVAIVRDRIEDMIARGLTLEQVRAARPTRDYDPRFGSDTGPWTTDMFVDAAYRSLRK